jgi:hypothetical protein
LTKDEALKLALKALEAGDWYIGQLEMIVYSSDDTGTHENRAKVQAVITAFKEALAQTSTQCEKQPTQEPVAWMDVCEKGQMSSLRYWSEPDNRNEIALYTAPQQQEPRNFCPRCGKRTADLTVIHTCTPPEGGHQ